MPHREIQLDVPKSVGPLTWPMGLTFLRLLLLPVFLWLLLKDVPIDPGGGHPYRYAAVAIFVLMAATDKLDGWLARKLNQSSKLGALLDPVADKLLVAASVVLLSFSSIAGPEFQIPTTVVIMVYAKDVFLALGTLALLALVGRVNIRARLPGKLSTVIQLALVLATLLAGDLQRIGPQFTLGLLSSLWWATVAIAIIASVDYFIQGWRQFKAAKTET